MAQEKVNSLVLRYADYSESSRMLTLFTLEHGKISASAKGCRRPKSALRSLTELYTLSELLLSGRTGRYTLTGGSLIDPFYDLRLDYERLNAASVMAQIANTVLPEEDPRPELFGLTARCLGLLAHEKLSPSQVLTYYSLQVLHLEGFPRIWCIVPYAAVRRTNLLSFPFGRADCSAVNVLIPSLTRRRSVQGCSKRFVIWRLQNPTISLCSIFHRVSRTIFLI